MAAMVILGQEESCSYRNSLTQLTLTCWSAWGKKDVSTCLTAIRWASSIHIQVTFNVVPRKKHVPILIKPCRSSLQMHLVAFSESPAIGLGLRRGDNWSTSVKQVTTGRLSRCARLCALPEHLPRQRNPSLFPP